MRPVKIYTKRSLKNDELQSLIAVLSHANLESETKSIRVKENWEEKLTLAKEARQPATAMCPGWITLVDDNGKQISAGRKAWNGGKYILNKHAKTVETIVQMGIEGLSPVAIARVLNQSKIPLMSRKKTTDHWGFSTIKDILSSRRLLGEYQPTRRLLDKDDNPTGKRVPDGDAIKGYYPAVIKETTFYELRKRMDARKRNVVGRRSLNINNLFGKILVDGMDGGTMLLSPTDRPDRYTMYSSEVLRIGKIRNGFSYTAFEDAFLKWVVEVNLSPLNQDHNPELDEAQSELTVVRGKIEEIKDAIKDRAGTVKLKPLLAVLDAHSEEESVLANKVERLKISMARSNADTKSIGGLVAQLKTAKGEDLRLARAKLRSDIHSVVKSIKLYIYGKNLLNRVCFAHVVFEDDLDRQFAVHTRRGKESVSYSDNLSYPIEHSIDSSGRNILPDFFAKWAEEILNETNQPTNSSESPVTPAKTTPATFDNEWNPKPVPLSVAVRLPQTR